MTLLPSFRTLFSLLLFLLLFACQSSGPDNACGLELNGGEKWKVNAEMKPHIEAAEARLNAFFADGEVDHVSLAKELQQHTQSLIQSCTMNGEAHDALHRWLHPHMALVERLAKDEMGSDEGTLIEQLRESFACYHNYFE